MWKLFVAGSAAFIALAGAAVDDNWRLHGGTQNDQRFSPLTQINEQTVSKLGLVWSQELGTTRGLEATPIVDEGVIYTTGAWSVVFAIDARTGEAKWTYDPRVPRERAYFFCCDVVNRGVALHHGKVFVGTLDGRLIALDQRSGVPLWSVQTTDPAKAYSITAAPRIARDKVVIGNGGADTECAAISPRTMSKPVNRRGASTPFPPTRAWASNPQRWQPPPKPGKARNGGKQVAGALRGRGWRPIRSSTSCISGPAMLRPGTELFVAKGDSLYTASILAVKSSTGELAWHFQTTPGDSFDYDATQPLIQADLLLNGRPRKVVLQARQERLFLCPGSANRRVPVRGAVCERNHWASGIDQKTGRPIELPGVADRNPKLLSPEPNGAHNWNPMAFHPATGLVYFPARIGTQMVHVPDTKWKYDPDRDNVGIDGNYEGPLFEKMASMPAPTGELLAWDQSSRRRPSGARSIPSWTEPACWQLAAI